MALRRRFESCCWWKEGAYLCFAHFHRFRFYYMLARMLSSIYSFFCYISQLMLISRDPTDHSWSKSRGTTVWQQAAVGWIFKRGFTSCTTRKTGSQDDDVVVVSMKAATEQNPVSCVHTRARRTCFLSTLFVSFPPHRYCYALSGAAVGKDALRSLVESGRAGWS